MSQQYLQFEKESHRTQVASNLPPIQEGYAGTAGEQHYQQFAYGYRAYEDPFPAQKIRPTTRRMSFTTWWRLALAVVSVFATVSLTHGILGDLSDAVGASPFLIVTRLIGLLIMGIVIVTVNIVVNRNN
jgi:hypothetical protein